MRDESLHQLAELAGLQVEWENFQGEQQTVAPSVICGILSALGFSVENEQATAASLEAYRSELANHRPSLLVCRAGETVQLPSSFGAGAAGSSCEAWLHAEEGDAAPLGLTVSNGGMAIAETTPPGYYRLELGSEQTRLAVAPARCLSVAELAGREHAWGLAAQLYSLRRPHDAGIGDFTALTQLAEGAAGAGADALAISPVHALFSADVHHFSPYSPSSRLFLNPLHVDLASAMAEAGVDPAALEGASVAELERLELIDWPAAAGLRLRLLRASWDRVRTNLLRGVGDAGKAFQAFRRERGAALENHARFEAIHAQQFAADPGRWHWRSWDPELRDPASAAVAQFARDNAAEVGFHIYLQWLAERGLAAAQRRSRDAGMGIGLVADLAVGTDTGGSHAWSYQQDMLIGLAIGAPPDLLHGKGQNWGLTTFSPDGLRQHGYQPFIDMLRACLRNAGGLRIDHILGLRRLWVIPEGGEGDGAYLRYPLDEMLKLIALESWRHRAVICGEDLGTVPEGLRDSLASAGILGMRVLWFERDSGLFIDRKRWSAQAMAMTTTHDLPTVAGWWSGRDIEWRARLGHLSPDRDEAAEQAERADDRRVIWSALEYAGVASGEPPPPDQPASVVEAAIRFVGGTPAPLVLVPLEDLLALPEQPNLPGTTDQHPNWRRRLPETASMLGQADVQTRLTALQEARSHS